MQRVNLYQQPFVADRVGSPPLYINAVVTKNADLLANGVPQATTKNELYVLVSALPSDLRTKVELAIQALIAGM